MAKIRVHEIAKEYNVPAKDVMTFLEGHNIEVSSHMSTLEDNAVALVRGKYGKSGEADADKKERPKKKSSISAVYNPQNSKMSNRRSNNGNRNGDRPQRQNGDRPQRANGENRQRQDGDRPRYDNRQRQNGDRPQRQNGDRP